MAKTNAERQAEYRLRKARSEGGIWRIDIQCDVSMKGKLERLAHYHGVTQKKLLNMLLSEAERKLVNRLSDEEADAYYDALLD